MVTLYDYETDDDKPKYPKNPITKTTFLNSLFDFPSGIDCRCISISPIFPNPMNENRPSMIANIKILDYMPNCKAFEVDEDGQYVEVDSESGENKFSYQYDNGGFPLMIKKTRVQEGGYSYSVTHYCEY